jgi:hypothetical protein
MSMSFENNVFAMGGNGFSTANRYPRQVANSADAVLTMVEGRSISVNAAIAGTNGANISWRFECGALTFFSNGGTTVPAAGFATDKEVGV